MQVTQQLQKCKYVQVCLRRSVFTLQNSIWLWRFNACYVMLAMFTHVFQTLGSQATQYASTPYLCRTYSVDLT